MIIQKCSFAWLQAKNELGIRVVAPYEVVDGATRHIFAAYLPDFGSPHGCYLYPVKSLGQTNEWKDIYSWSQAHQCYVSFIHIDDYCTYDRDRFVEALRDWGYFGSDLLCPLWLKINGVTKSMGSD